MSSATTVSPVEHMIPAGSGRGKPLAAGEETPEGRVVLQLPFEQPTRCWHQCYKCSSNNTQ